MAQSKSFFDDVKKEIECPVCQEQFSGIKEPKILKCFHTFCKSCLEGWLRQQGGETLSCPKCRQITKCPDNNITSLPSNLFYKQMVDIVEAYSAQGQEDSPRCGNCDERKSLKFYCADCNHFLCEDCAGGHRKWKVLSSHRVKEIGKFESSDAQDYARKANACKQHKDEFRFFCEQCETCICRDCAILDHEDHKKMSLEKGLEKKKSEIEVKIREVRVNGSRLRIHKESLEKRRLKVNNCFEQATKKVQEAAECCINLIRRHAESVTERLMKEKDSFEAEFLNQMTSLDGKLTAIGSSVEFGEEVLFRNNLQEILNVEEMLEKRLRELSVPFEPMLNFPEIKYSRNDMSSLADAPGKLHTTNTEPSLSAAEGQGLTEAVQGECATFTIITKDAKKETTYSEIDEIDVTINSTKTKRTVKTNVTDCNNGQYLVKYKSEVAGDFNVSISVRGEAIKGSPFNLTVTEKTTEGSAVVKSVVQKRQEFEGGTLTVKPYEESMKMDNHDYEVFELVSAELCLETVEILTRGKTKILLDEIARKTGIKWIETSETFTMSGDFKQVERSRTYLQQAISQSGGIAVFSGLKRMTQHHKNDENESQCNGDENDGGLNHASTMAIALLNKVPPPDQETHKTQSSHAAYATPPVILYFEVEPKFIKVFVKAYKTEVNGIEAEYHVEVPREAKGGRIGLIPKGGCSSEEYEKACNLFIDLYQKMAQIMKMERFSLKNEENVVGARKTILEMSKTFPVSVETAKDKKHWEMYGEERDLEAALEYLRTKEIEIKRESGKDKGTGEFQVPMDVGPPDSSRGSKRNDPLETYIGGVKLSVYKGDLTSEQVDVIVNAANNSLRHDGGVAKAILDRGGKLIEVESNKIIAKRGPLKDGEAVITDSGYLPCKKVVHAVGPVFRDVGLSQSKNLLRRACLNSLTIAQEYISIALPAIGSGSYGMPKDECAKVMFDAVGKFVKQGTSKKKKITDIRFVNIDDPSVQAFKTEFISRYGNDHEHSGRSVERLPDGAKGATNSLPSSSRANRGKEKRKNSSGNSRSSTNPGNVVSTHHQNTSGSSVATNDQPLSNYNPGLLSNTSYSDAVRNNMGGGTETRSSTAQELAGAGKKGYYPPNSGTTDPKDEGSAAGGAGSATECPICLDTVTNPETLKCKHVFCTDCVKTALKHDNRCPVCKEVQGVMRGNQPIGQMQFCKRRERLPGFNDCGTIIIDYHFSPGTQGREHPNPGRRYGGTHRTAYLPDNREGNEVLQLLKKAFDARLVFTVGTSVTTGLQDQITWNDIHHKTSILGGPQGFGYPDPDYLRRVKEDLAAKGIR